MDITMFLPAPRYFERQKWCRCWDGPKGCSGSMHKVLRFVCWHLEKKSWWTHFFTPHPQKKSRVCLNMLNKRETHGSMYWPKKSRDLWAMISSSGTSRVLSLPNPEPTSSKFKVRNNTMAQGKNCQKFGWLVDFASNLLVENHCASPMIYLPQTNDTWLRRTPFWHILTMF